MFLINEMKQSITDDRWFPNLKLINKEPMETKLVGQISFSDIETGTKFYRSADKSGKYLYVKINRRTAVVNNRVVEFDGFEGIKTQIK